MVNLITQRKLQESAKTLAVPYILAALLLIMLLGAGGAFAQDSSYTPPSAPALVDKVQPSHSHDAVADKNGAAESDGSADAHDLKQYWPPLLHHRMYFTKEEIDNLPESELQRRPMLYWHKWADKPLPVVPAGLLLWVCALGANVLVPGNLAMARTACRQSFWRCFGLGLLAVSLNLGFARLMFISQIGIPLALLTLGVGELVVLLGFATAATLLGERVVRATGLANKLSSRPLLWSFILPTLGTIILTCMLALPGFLHLPPLGIRLVMLFSLLGAGGLLRTRMGTR